MTSKILVAGSQPVMRHAIRTLLEERGFQVVGAASDAEEAVEAARRSRPDVTVLDASVRDADAAEIARRIHAAWPRTRVLLLADGEDFSAARHLADGVAGVVDKSSTPEQFVQAVGELSSGTLRWDARRPARQELSPRQREVLVMIAAAKSTREIAAHFGVSPKTVESHRSSIMEKLGIHDIASLVRFAMRHGVDGAESRDGTSAAHDQAAAAPQGETRPDGNGAVRDAARAALHSL